MLEVRNANAVEGTILVAANPCGDAANITLVTYDVDGTANVALEDPILAGGVSTYPIPSGENVMIRVRTRPGLEGRYVQRTSLIVRIEDAVITIPVILNVDAERTSVEEDPFNRPAFLDLSAR